MSVRCAAAAPLCFLHQLAGLSIRPASICKARPELFSAEPAKMSPATRSRTRAQALPALTIHDLPPDIVVTVLGHLPLQER